MEHLIFITFLFFFSLLIALFEIQVEGQHGWAEKLPTWKIENKWTRYFYSKRPLTGYHLYLQLSMLLIVHCPFAFNMVSWQIELQLRILAFYILFWIIEDFLWFMFNPHFGPKNFKPDYIWWHRETWLWIMPKDYWIWIPVGTILYVLSYNPLIN